MAYSPPSVPLSFFKQGFEPELRLTYSGWHRLYYSRVCHPVRNRSYRVGHHTLYSNCRTRDGYERDIPYHERDHNEISYAIILFSQQSN
jgi:hypothetical protein